MYSILILFHIFGTVLGAGGAFVSDALFIGSASDRVLTKGEIHLLHVASRVVWFGLSILIVSGVLMVWMSNFAVLALPYFQAKMTLVAILLVNGLVFHYTHLPFIETLAGKRITKKLLEDGDTRDHFRSIFISGALSMTSWVTVIVLGTLGAVSQNYFEVMGYYVVFFIIVLIVGGFVQRILLLEVPKISGKKAIPHGDSKVSHLVVGIAYSVLFVVLLSTALQSSTPSRPSAESVLPSLTPKAQLLPAPANEQHLSYAPEVPQQITRSDQRYFEVHIEVLENVCDLDRGKGIQYETWGYRVAGDEDVSCGAPGPVLRGRVGDVARITLTNLPENQHPHNIDFHAVTGAGGGAKDLTVAPGETASIEVRLLYPGTFMYHCAYGDVPVHISQGMYGMFIVDPEVSLPTVDHEWAVMQSEWYVTEPDENGLVQTDAQAIFDEEPEYITFNGKVGALTGDNALAMSVGERARIYFVNQGLNLDSNFHPIGSHWDVVYPEAATHSANSVVRGSQSTLVVAGGGTVTELVAQVPLSIKLVDHALSRTFYKGALGIINVVGPENHELFEVIEAAAGWAASHTQEEYVNADDGLDEAHVEAINEKESAPMSEVIIDVSVVIPPGAGDKRNVDIAFTPRVVRIKTGTTVIWENTDSMMHTVTSGVGGDFGGIPDGNFNSGYLRPGEKFALRFNEPGEFSYFCTPHPWAMGTIIVE